MKILIMGKLYGYDGAYKESNNDKIIKKIEKFYNFLANNNIPIGIFIDNEKIKITFNKKDVIIDIRKKLKEKILEKKLKQIDLLAYYRFFQGFDELEKIVNKDILIDIIESIKIV